MPVLGTLTEYAATKGFVVEVTLTSPKRTGSDDLGLLPPQPISINVNATGNAKTEQLRQTRRMRRDEFSRTLKGTLLLWDLGQSHSMSQISAKSSYVTRSQMLHSGF
jgi:hypothetical protein